LFCSHVIGSTRATPQTWLGWARHNELIIHEVMFSRANSKRSGRHRTLVTDMADDISHVCSFASQDLSLPYNTEEFNHECSLFAVVKVVM